MSKKHFLVRVGNGIHRDNIIVDASYYKIEDGTLVFRNDRDGMGPRGYAAYPETVRSFAAGYWRDVERITKSDVSLYTDGD